MQSILQHRRIGYKVRNSSTDGENALDHSAIGVVAETTSEKSTAQERLLVDFAQSDPENPREWAALYKWSTTITVGFAGFLVGWSSSIDSAVLQQARHEFGVSEVAESLATAIYLIGFGFGALFSGPLSETFGRNPVFLSTLALFAAWTLGSALAPNFEAQVVFRLLAGLAGATPLTTFGGSVADMWSLTERTCVFPIMACMSFLGPFLAPMVGAFIGQSSVTWRWTEWTTLIWTGMVFTGIALFAPETHAPTILLWKARHLQRLTGNDKYVAVASVNTTTLTSKMKTSMTRPFILFAREPIVMAFTLYLSVIYVILFTFLTGYDFIFGPTGIYHLKQGQEGLCFIGLNIGFLLAMACCPWIYYKYKRAIISAEKMGTVVAPEQRLWYAMIAAPFCPVSLFWMGWTSYPSIPFWSPVAASVLFGFSMQGIFITSYQYLIDSYESFAASALVSLTFVRYVLAGVMVVVSIPMYSNIGVHWTLTLLACISVILTSVPYLLYVYGHRIRQRSKFAGSS